MKRLLLASLLVAAVLLALGAAAACDNDGDSVGEDGTTPAATVTPEVTPEESDENGTADGATDEDPDATLRAEAEALCPAEFLEPCAEAYIAFATGSLEAALCIFPEGKWAMVTPEGDIGDSCGTPPDIGVIAAIVGGQ
jgi:hypothetical protein